MWKSDYLFSSNIYIHQNLIVKAELPKNGLRRLFSKNAKFTFDYRHILQPQNETAKYRFLVSVGTDVCTRSEWPILDSKPVKTALRCLPYFRFFSDFGVRFTEKIWIWGNFGPLRWGGPEFSIARIKGTQHDALDIGFQCITGRYSLIFVFSKTNKYPSIKFRALRARF